MPRRFATSIDLMGLALLNAAINPLSSDPVGLGAGDAGRMWVNTAVPTVKYWNGTTAIDLLARANQTGTQLASTISNFTATVQAIQWSSMAAPAGAVNMSTQNFTNLATASANGQAVEYAQFNNAIAAVQAGLDFKAPPATVVVTSNMSLTAPGTTINGHTMVAGDTVLLTAQTTASQNGIYTWNSATSLTRRADSSTNTSIYSGTMISVGAADSTNPDTVWMQTAVGTGTNGALILGTDSQTWIKPFTSSSYSAGNGINIAGSTISAKQGTGASQAVNSAAIANNGIVVDGNGIYIDPATGVRKVWGTIPTATAGIYTVAGAVCTIAHALNDQYVQVCVFAGSAPPTIGGSTPAAGEEIEVQIIRTDANNVQLTFPAAPAANNYNFSIQG
jgi:hypothetical protein